ncbi:MULTISPECIES: TetR/AcrR family transcriptional regulator [Terrisporobacter]|uniref:TetR/AcrR family transcriptional regulator n=2 Tax=Terrisporobacter hibernicus TaxID=2813371 RepID=A0AAX2ZEK9_9FIRM|nr:MULTISPECIES: TetR/AcrR family transcriptional regulator [Terrisporobacter]UEL47754.1 TetR/AcrR family transcriptional regulator [Terrisporobacter hibernicus]
MTEIFNKLDEEKRLAIINSGLEIFSIYGFQKSSTDLIARKAGISKGLLFYYFKNKLSYFEFLFEYSQKIISSSIDMDLCRKTRDFFEVLECVIDQKYKLLTKYPHIFNFIVVAYWSNDNRIIDIVSNKVISYDNFNIYEYLDNIDKSKFKNEEDIHKVIEMLSLMLDGYIQNKLKMNEDIDINEIMKKYKVWTSLLKEAVYK